MSRTATIRSIALVCLLTPLPASAQLLKARDEPIVYSHHHLNVTDVAAHTKFFAGTLGGVPVTVAGQQIVMQRLEDLGVLTSFVTDPWGTSIQLTEGLDAIK